MKKNLPLNVVQNFKPSHNKFAKIVRPQKDDKFLLRFLDIDSESKFHFSIDLFNDKDNKFYVEHSPINRGSNGISKRWLNVDEVNKAWDNWINILESFEKAETIFDDEILKGFEQEYYEYFELVDNEEAKRPLTSKAILALDSHLEYISKQLPAFKSEDISQEIEDIQQDTIQLRKSLTRVSRKEVLNKLSLIWAKITKLGPQVYKEILKETKKQVIKGLVTGAIELL